MKAYSNIKKVLLLLFMAVAAVGTHAQTAPAQWRMYQPGMSNSGGWMILGQSTSPDMELKSIKFTDTNYDVYALTSSKGVKDDGRWYMRVVGAGALSIPRLKCGIVSAEYSDELIEEMFLNGQLTDLREANNHEGFADDFIVEEDGSYKPVVFGYDEQGTYRGYAVGETETFSTTVDCNDLLIQIWNTSSHCYWGYGSLMHIRDIMGEDYAAVGQTGYDHYASWARNTYMGSNYLKQQFIWSVLDQAIGSLEQTIDMIQKRSQIASVDQASYGTALAMRAMLYLDAARMYEFLDNDGVSSINQAGNDVSGLTYPIGSAAYHQKNGTTVNRATRSEMAAYILNDLNKAEEVLNGATKRSKLQADLAVVYGLKARLYMWTEDYEQAKTYAGKAITYGQHTPLTQSEWLDTTRGFNDSSMSSWMWAMNYPEDSEPVATGIINWTSWSCNEDFFGYFGASTELYAAISKAIYDRISDTDFRKLSFKAPYGSALSGQEPHIAGGSYDYMPEYASLKFRPGQGEVDDYHVGCAVDVPLMRIEEMYFIRCEADAMQGYVEAAKEKLNAFMKYRDPNYSTDANTRQDIIDEIFLQKRIEFWGEGLNYFDYKRLNKPVTRNYAGTNFDQLTQFNTTTRPAWMNIVFVMNAYNGAIEDWNNPDPSDCYNTGTR